MYQKTQIFQLVCVIIFFAETSSACTRNVHKFFNKCYASNNSKATAVTTHQANQFQFICTRKLVSCSTHLQSYVKVDNETKCGFAIIAK